MKQLKMSEMLKTFELCEFNPEIFTFLCQDIADDLNVSEATAAGAMFALYQWKGAQDKAQKAFLIDYTEEILPVNIIWDEL